MKKNYLDIIDPIHDFIRVYDYELPIIDNPLFQRLRRIKQLSGAHLTYPSAQHSRFEHSLGVMHIASQAGFALNEKGFLNSDDIQILRLAGLLHDIGHGPFSHLFEEVIQEKKISHEDYGKKIILNSEIGDVLSKTGFDKKLIAKIAFGESKFQYLNEIVSGALSADMMDYLLRDGYFTGAEHAKIDHKRITQSLDVHKKKLALERSALYSFESMMHSRYQMFKAVYFHKTGYSFITQSFTLSSQAISSILNFEREALGVELIQHYNLHIKQLQSVPVTQFPYHLPDTDPDPDLSEIIENRDNVEEVDISTTLPSPEKT